MLNIERLEGNKIEVLVKFHYKVGERDGFKQRTKLTEILNEVFGADSVKQTIDREIFGAVAKRIGSDFPLNTWGVGVSRRAREERIKIVRKDVAIYGRIEV